MYKLNFFEEAAEIFGGLDKEIQRSIKNKLKVLSVDPDLALKLKSFRKLSGVKNGYRIRIGRYRVLYVLIREEEIWVCDIFIKKSGNDYKKAIRRLVERGVLEI